MDVPDGLCPLSQQQIIEAYYAASAARLVELAAFLDRVERAAIQDAAGDPRLTDIRDALLLMVTASSARASQALLQLSVPLEQAQAPEAPETPGVSGQGERAPMAGRPAAAGALPQRPGDHAQQSPSARATSPLIQPPPGYLDLAAQLEPVDLAAPPASGPLLLRTPPGPTHYKATELLVATLLRQGLDPGRAMLVGAQEHTLELILFHGFWAGITLDPASGVSPERAADMVELFGPRQLCALSAGPGAAGSGSALIALAAELRRRGHAEQLVAQLLVENPREFLRSTDGPVNGRTHGLHGRTDGHDA